MLRTALGSFPLCGVEINTVPVPDDEIGIGESISDQATVTGTGLNAPPPTGTVDFVCGPLAAGAVCDTGGTLVSIEDLDGISNPSIVTSDRSPRTRPDAGASVASTPGDDNYDEAVDFDESECFTVNPASR